jgi:chromate transporter
VLVLLGCGLLELALRTLPAAGGTALHTATLPALVWTAFKVGGLSYGGGYVIIPLMQADAVEAYGWMTQAEFLNAVALGQLTPGPVTQTVGAVGYAAAGLGGGILAAAVAFLPSFLLVGLGAERFERVRASARARAFLDGAGPAAIGAILGAAVPLADGLSEAWQVAVLAAAAVALLVLGRGTMAVLLTASAAGALVGAGGGPLP